MKEYQYNQDINRTMWTVIGIWFLISGALWSAGCGPVDITVNHTTQETKEIALQVDQGSAKVTDAPYSFSNNPSCWSDQVRTNGQTYGQSDNSGYYCTGGGGSYLTYATDHVWIGFYRDGTISVSDSNHQDQIYTASGPGALNAFGISSINCELDLFLGGSPTVIMAKANYPGIPTTVLDSDNRLKYVELQTLVGGVLDSGSVWTCEWKPVYGTQ